MKKNILNQIAKYMRSSLCIMHCALCITSGLLVACQDGDWDAPADYTIWNDTITERNIITLSDLKKQYKDAISNNSYALIEEDVQFKGVVTVNDEGGNISQQIVVKDNSGYIIIGIRENSIYSYVKTGQQILINLKGLYIGGYGMNGQIGYPSMSSTSGAKRIGHMAREIWYEHVKFLGDPDPSLVPEPIEFFSYLDKDTYSDYIVYAEGLFTDADGESLLAPDKEVDAGNAVNRSLLLSNGGGLVDIRTSAYSDFCKMRIPRGRVRVYGVAIRYNNSSWQIQMRTAKDLVSLEEAE